MAKRKPHPRRPTAPTQSRRGPARRPPSGRSPAPASSPLRRRVERMSLRPIVMLARSPSWLLPVLVGGAALAGLLLGGVPGAVLLGLATGSVLWLTYLSWPAIDARGRLLRGVLVGLLLAATVMTGLD